MGRLVLERQDLITTWVCVRSKARRCAKALRVHADEMAALDEGKGASTVSH